MVSRFTVLSSREQNIIYEPLSVSTRWAPTSSFPAGCLRCGGWCAGRGLSARSGVPQTRRPPMEQAVARLTGILERLDAQSVDPARLPAAGKLLALSAGRRHRSRTALVSFVAGVITVTAAVGFALQLHTQHGLAHAILKWRGCDLYDSRVSLSNKYLKPTFVKTILCTTLIYHSRKLIIDIRRNTSIKTSQNLETEF